MPSGKSIQAGRAGVQIFGDNSRLIGTLRGTERRLNAFAARTAKIGATLFGAGVAGAALFKGPLDAAAAATETMNKFDVVFGGRSEAVKQWSDQFAELVGRGKTQIADFMAGTQDLFVPLGFEADAAEAMSKQITELSVDLASFNNKADADVLRDLHAALTGSGEVMKKYGVIVSEAAVKQELLNTGMDPRTATDQMKVQARLAIIMRGTTAAQGDAVRSADSYTNQMKAADGALTDLKETIGKEFEPAAASVVKRFVALTRAGSVWIKQNKGLVAGAGLTVAGLLGAGAAVLTFAAGIKLAAITLGTATTALQLFGGGIALLTSPIGLTTAAIIGLGIVAQKQFGIFSSAIKRLTPDLAALKRDGLAALNGIADALSSGDLGLAARIGWGLVELEFAKGLAALDAVWLDWSQGFLKGWGEFWAGADLVVGGLFRDEAAAAEAEARVGKAMSELTAKQTAERLEREKKAAGKVAAAQKTLEENIAKAKTKAQAEEANKNASNAAANSGSGGGGTGERKSILQAGTSQSGIAGRLAFAFKVGQDTSSKVKRKTDSETESVDQQTDSLKKNASAWAERRKQLAQQYADRRIARTQARFGPVVGGKDGEPESMQFSTSYRRAVIARSRAQTRFTRIDFDREGVQAEMKQKAEQFKTQRRQQAEQAAGFHSNRPHFADTIGRAEQILQTLERDRASGSGAASLTSIGNLPGIVAFANANRRFSGQKPSATVTRETANQDLSRVIGKLDEVRKAIEDAAPRYR